MVKDDGPPDLPPAAGAPAMNPESWYREPGVCGSCIAWRPGEPRGGETVAAGTCRLRAELSRVPATLTKCDLYKPRGEYVYRPAVAAPARRRRSGAARVLRRTDSGTLVPAARPVQGRPSRVPEHPAVPRDVDLGTSDRVAVAALLREVMQADGSPSGREMLPRFAGGTLRVMSVAGEERSVPIERFFSCIERFRTALDALEDRITRHDALGRSRDDLRRQLRAMQGSLTTFNVLYARRGDYFSGKQ